MDCVNFAVGCFKDSRCVYVCVGRVVVLISFGHQLNVSLAFNEFTAAYNAWLLGGYGTSAFLGQGGCAHGTWPWGTPGGTGSSQSLEGHCVVTF